MAIADEGGGGFMRALKMAGDGHEAKLDIGGKFVNGRSGDMSHLLSVWRQLYPAMFWRENHGAFRPYDDSEDSFV
jgi:hypothetical protein